MNELLCDIGTASVGVAHAVLAEGNPPDIRWLRRKEIPIAASLDLSRVIPGMIEALQSLLDEMSREHPFRPDEVLVLLASPLVHTELHSVRLVEKTPVVITAARLKNLVQTEVEKSSAPEGGLDVLVERNVVEVRLNGYPTACPIGKRAQEVEANISLAFGTRREISAVQDLFARMFHRSRITWYTDLTLAFLALRDVLRNHESYFIVNPEGELTDVGLVTAGLLTQTASFPLGGSTLVRELAGECRSLTEEVASALRMHKDGTATPTEQAGRCIADVRERWRGGWRAMRTAFEAHGLLPNRAFVLGEGALGETIRAVLVEEGLAAERLSPGLLSPFVTGGAQGDFNLMAMAAMHHKKEVI